MNKQRRRVIGLLIALSVPLLLTSIGAATLILPRFQPGLQQRSADPLAAWNRAHEALMGSLAHVSSLFGRGSTWMMDALGLPESTVHAMGHIGLQAGLGAILLAAFLLLVFMSRRWPKQAYAALVLAVIFSMVSPPLFQAYAVYASAERQRLPLEQAPAAGPLTPEELDAALVEALQSYLNLSANSELDPAMRQQLEAELIQAMESLRHSARRSWRPDRPLLRQSQATQPG